MGSEPVDRTYIFNQMFEELNVSQAQLARIMNLGTLSQAARNRVSDRLCGRTGITKDVALCVQLLAKLQEMGVDIIAMEFDETGILK